LKYVKGEIVCQEMRQHIKKGFIRPSICPGKSSATDPYDF